MEICDEFYILPLLNILLNNLFLMIAQNFNETLGFTGLRKC